MSQLQEAGHRLVACLGEFERRLRRTGGGPPGEDVKAELAEKLDGMSAAIARFAEGLPTAQEERARRDLRELLTPWLLRSELFARSLGKPHGYPGDFGLLERLDALREVDGVGDPTKPAFVACLDHAFLGLDFVRALPKRRAWAVQLLLEQRRLRGRPLRILDIAPRGARHVLDYLDAVEGPDEERVTILDDDPTVLAFYARALDRWPNTLRAASASLARVSGELGSERFDVVLLASRLDALDDESASEDLAKLVEHVRPGGIIACSSLLPTERSRHFREWLLDWPMTLRSETELAALFPARAGTTLLGRRRDGLLATTILRLADIAEDEPETQVRRALPSRVSSTPPAS